MEKLLVLPSSRSKMEALKAFLTALNIDFKPVSAADDAAAITDPELLRRIEDFEQGKTAPQPFPLEKLKAMINA